MAAGGAGDGPNSDVQIGWENAAMSAEPAPMQATMIDLSLTAPMRLLLRRAGAKRDAAELRERARGALLGLAVGDALGAPAENMKPSEIRARWGRITGYVAEKPAGTDDTEYAIFSGLLLASSLEGPYRADYLADLATSEGRVELRERVVGNEEAGQAPHQVCTGQVVRLIRDGRAHAANDPAFQSLRAGDRILEIIDSR